MATAMLSGLTRAGGSSATRISIVQPTHWIDCKKLYYLCIFLFTAFKNLYWCCHFLQAVLNVRQPCCREAEDRKGASILPSEEGFPGAAKLEMASGNMLEACTLKQAVSPMPLSILKISILLYSECSSSLAEFTWVWEVIPLFPCSSPAKN